MLVAHAAIEASLRRVVARCGEMNRAESLVDVVLRESRRDTRKGGRQRGGKSSG